MGAEPGTEAVPGTGSARNQRAASTMRDDDGVFRDAMGAEPGTAAEPGTVSARSRGHALGQPSVSVAAKFAMAWTSPEKITL